MLLFVKVKQVIMFYLKENVSNMKAIEPIFL